MKNNKNKKIDVELWDNALILDDIMEKQNIDIEKLKQHKKENKEDKEFKSQIPNSLNLDSIIDEIEQEITKELQNLDTTK